MQGDDVSHYLSILDLKISQYGAYPLGFLQQIPDRIQIC
jgi:hypothetical protein